MKSKLPMRISESNKLCKPTNKLVCIGRCISKLQKSWKGIKNCALSQRVKDIKTEVNTNRSWQSF